MLSTTDLHQQSLPAVFSVCWRGVLFCFVFCLMLTHSKGLILLKQSYILNRFLKEILKLLEVTSVVNWEDAVSQ